MFYTLENSFRKPNSWLSGIFLRHFKINLSKTIFFKSVENGKKQNRVNNHIETT